VVRTKKPAMLLTKAQQPVAATDSSDFKIASTLS
jgi:hypothetical protein